jgi:hypothetical protein
MTCVPSRAGSRLEAISHNARWRALFPSFADVRRANLPEDNALGFSRSFSRSRTLLPYVAEREDNGIEVFAPHSACLGRARSTVVRTSETLHSDAVFRRKRRLVLQHQMRGGAGAPSARSTATPSVSSSRSVPAEPSNSIPTGKPDFVSPADKTSPGIPAQLPGAMLRDMAT